MNNIQSPRTSEPIAPLAREMLPHQSRVILERIQLADRVNKLEAFLVGEASAKLPKEEKSLLSVQLEYMAMYLRVLDLRVANYVGAKKYVCHKEVLARAMSRGTYNDLRGWDIPADENPTDAGYLTESLDGDAPNHCDFAGYITWIPKDMFERGYEEIR